MNSFVGGSELLFQRNLIRDAPSLLYVAKESTSFLMCNTENDDKSDGDYYCDDDDGDDDDRFC